MGSRKVFLKIHVYPLLSPHHRSKRETGFAAQAYAREVKEARYGVEFASHELDLVVETFGAVCQKGKDLLNFVANSVAKCRSISLAK